MFEKILSNKMKKRDKQEATNRTQINEKNKIPSQTADYKNTMITKKKN